MNLRSQPSVLCAGGSVRPPQLQRRCLHGSPPPDEVILELLVPRSKAPSTSDPAPPPHQADPPFRAVRTRHWS